MNILTVYLFFGLILVKIRSDLIGYNELNLIDERMPFKIKCLSNEIKDHSDIKWFNVTLKSTDPYNHRNGHILIDETNEFFTIQSNGELFSRSARSEHNGYYSCRVRYPDHLKRGDHKLTDYRLHLIEVTKSPMISKLEDFLVIEVFTDNEWVDNKTIDDLFKDLILNKEFETKINFESKKILCKFNSDLNLMKCELKIKSESKRKCHKSQCSSDKYIFEQKVEKDLLKMQTLLKTNEELFKKKLNIQLIDFEVKRSKANVGSECPPGYYSHSNRCRPCPSGKYRSNAMDRCIDCPTNTYNPYFGQSSCFNCPESSLTAGPGFESLGEGATDIHECKFFYNLGFYGFIKDLITNIFD